MILNMSPKATPSLFIIHHSLFISRRSLPDKWQFAAKICGVYISAVSW